MLLGLGLRGDLRVEVRVRVKVRLGLGLGLGLRDRVGFTITLKLTHNVYFIQYILF